MTTSGNTILITGGGSGIGRALAEAFVAKCNQIIITGRSASTLEAVRRENPDILARTLDVTNPDDIQALAKQIVQEFPKLNVLVNMAGIMQAEDLRSGVTTIAEATIATNLLGPIRMNTALIPHLTGKPGSTILMVFSGLAFVPLGLTPTYCATKAAIHSYTQSLRHQLRGTIMVTELVPPYVQTELMGAAQAIDPKAMPLAEYISETMALMEQRPEADELLVKRARFFRFAERENRYDETYNIINS